MCGLFDPIFNRQEAMFFSIYKINVIAQGQGFIVIMAPVRWLTFVCIILSNSRHFVQASCQ